MTEPLQLLLYLSRQLAVVKLCVTIGNNVGSSFRKLAKYVISLCRCDGSAKQAELRSGRAQSKLQKLDDIRQLDNDAIIF